MTLLCVIYRNSYKYVFVPCLFTLIFRIIKNIFIVIKSNGDVTVDLIESYVNSKPVCWMSVRHK